MELRIEVTSELFLDDEELASNGGWTHALPSEYVPLFAHPVYKMKTRAKTLDEDIIYYYLYIYYLRMRFMLYSTLLNFISCAKS